MQHCKSCRTCFKFYCMFYFTCDRSFMEMMATPLLPKRRHKMSSVCVAAAARIPEIGRPARRRFAPRKPRALSLSLSLSVAASIRLQRLRPILIATLGLPVTYVCVYSCAGVVGSSSRGSCMSRHGNRHKAVMLTKPKHSRPRPRPSHNAKDIYDKK